MAGNSTETLDIKLKVWRQSSPKDKGAFKEYSIGVSPDMSFLEMFDELNEKLIHDGVDPVEFDHDCREGICGSCNMMINGQAHGPSARTATCQLHMRSFKDGDSITVEPWRASAFPIIKDLVVDRSSFDRIQQAGGFISINTGSAQDANATPIEKDLVDEAFDYATCIGCGACAASCPNSSASLFVGAKVAHLALLPQGQAERSRRVVNMINQMEEEGFGDCSNHAECEAVCPKGISISSIAKMRREHAKAAFSSK